MKLSGVPALIWTKKSAVTALMDGVMHIGCARLHHAGITPLCNTPSSPWQPVSLTLPRSDLRFGPVLFHTDLLFLLRHTLYDVHEAILDKLKISLLSAFYSQNIELLGF